MLAFLLIFFFALSVWTVFRRLSRTGADDSAVRAEQGGVVFLAGPAMAQDFSRHAASIRSQRYVVLVSTDESQLPTAQSMREDLAALLQADCVAVMPLWNYWARPRLLVATAHAMG